MASEQSGQGRGASKKVRVAFRRNRLKPAREKDWTRRALEADGAPADSALKESVVAKGGLSRKRTVIVGETPLDEATWVTGTVVAMRGLVADVDDGQKTWPCTVRRVLRTRLIRERHPVTVGDRVRFSRQERPGVEREGVIETVEPRQGALTRVVGKRLHVIVANVEQAIIVASVDAPPLKPQLIDRYIVAAQHGQIEPVVCLNKIDLDVGQAAARVLETYRLLGYRTLATSATTNVGIAALRATLAGKCSVVAGQSGVGKSSLLNAVDPELRLQVGDVCVETRKGSHTTTTATLIRLADPDGGYVVDTPGVRSFDVSVVPTAEIEMHFVEFAEFIPRCKFPDCLHTHETGCAVKEAVSAGRISPERYESYRRMYEERISSASSLRR